MIQEINFKPGDVVRVHQKIREGEKSRIQVFEGVVLCIRGRGENKSFTARKVVDGIAVERIWPIMSPNVEKVEIKGKIKAKINRSKLYFLRKRDSSN